MKKLLLAAALLASAPAGAEAPLPETRFEGDRTLLLRDGAEFTFRDCAREQRKRHPSLQAEDMLKLCVQGACGPEHILGGTEAAERAFEEEFSSVPARPERALYEIISPDFLRVDLSAWKASRMPSEWLFRMFAASARTFRDSDAVLKKYLDEAEDLLSGEQRTRFAELRKTGRTAVRHSKIYHDSEAPSYRLVSTRFLHVFPVLLKAAALPDKPVRVLAIDGRSASGKTTLARQLAGILRADVVHMDDFFLPPELRTEARYAEPGGNVHYERFSEEVLPHLRGPEAFSYRVFDCSTMKYGAGTEIRSKPWRIVEGAYSLNPKFGDYADLKIFYDIAPEEQVRRIRLRNGERGLRMFRTRWIPLEEKYILNCGPDRRADLILGRRRTPSKLKEDIRAR